MTVPDDPVVRKSIPLASGCLDYFPSALVAVAALSAKGNDQHNPGTPLHWDRTKSGDEADALFRHFLQRGTVDTDGVLHSTKVAWRALAALQKELEALGAPIARGARNVVIRVTDDDGACCEKPAQPASPFPDISSLPDSPIVAALLQIHDEDGPTSGLKAGEALNPVSQNTGD